MTYRTICTGEDDFRFVDGFALVPRAMLHAMPNCPTNIRNELQWAVDRGYIKVVANIPEKEYAWEKLSA